MVPEKIIGKVKVIMNKTQFIEAVAESGNLSKKDAANAVNAFINTVTAALKNGEKVQIVGFGTFETRKREEKACRNPRTGEMITAPAANRPVFKAGKGFKDALN